ncbi:tetratricopeptide repeat protein [Phenylobacterium sp.]|uniref:tetratricopeptide repeat protein n=1 Tax=Phenylobacterium sp. TaxID=1871053 RepID=UPI0011F9076D|nr:tetratricopeptide repeat protein [Phenylobacterium sp.]THD68178.1 MAG: tetratricopeptide repeat protein [Phenylobacterium sp.]
MGDAELMEAERPDADLQAVHAQGLAHHRAGRLDEARRAYEQVLAADPRHFESLHLLGVYAVQIGRPDAAVELIGQAIAVRADVADAHGNLASAFNSLRRYGEALEASDRAIALNPDFAQAHGNRGEALHQLGRLPEALASYERVVALQPTAPAHYNRATMLRELGRLEAALAGYDLAIALKPDYAEARRSRGIVLCDLRRSEEGLESFGQAIALKPDDADAWLHRGATLRELGHFEDALAALDRAIELRPTYAEAHGNRGNVLCDLWRYQEAVVSYDRATELKPDYFEVFSNKVLPLRELRRMDDALAAADRAVALNPDYAEGLNNRGGALYGARRLDEALATYDRAIALKPDYPSPYNNRGVVLYELRRFDEALASLEHALSLRPDYAEAHHSLAMCRLMLGDFADGWARYEWRWKAEQFRTERRDLGARLWLGAEDLQGRTILLRSEQGLGDTLQFCRYALDVAALGAEVILEVQPGLERLLARLDGVARVITLGEAPPPHEFQTPLMSLPHALGAAPDGRLARYLDADPQDVAAWASRLAGTAARRVGLCWAGGARPYQMVANSIDQRRSLSLEAFAPLAGAEDVAFYSLQKGPPAAQLAELQAKGWAGPEITNLTSELADFADTAALVANLDLVITCDTAVAHLVGGLGKPVWILNRHDACWRWLDGRNDSPWYPSAQLFRQPSPGDWASVMEEVRVALGAWASQT